MREAAHPKFYWFDPGVARAAAGLIREPADRLWQGAALETLIFHELRVYNEISRKKRPLAYYRTASGVEIDFIIESRKRSASTPAHLVAIEVKRADKWSRSWESGLRDLAIQKASRWIVWSPSIPVTRVYHFEGLDVLPVSEFLQSLYQGKIF